MWALIFQVTVTRYFDDHDIHRFGDYNHEAIHVSPHTYDFGTRLEHIGGGLLSDLPDLLIQKKKNRTSYSAGFVPALVAWVLRKTDEAISGECAASMMLRWERIRCPCSRLCTSCREVGSRVLTRWGLLKLLFFDFSLPAFSNQWNTNSRLRTKLDSTSSVDLKYQCHWRSGIR